VRCVVSKNAPEGRHSADLNPTSTSTSTNKNVGLMADIVLDEKTSSGTFTA
jgi:hypothetical protein